jgi:CheY-like chemotaxis protein
MLNISMQRKGSHLLRQGFRILNQKYQALKLLNSYPETAHIPVIALTANAMKGEREQGLAAGFVDYLTKPLDIQKLIAVLEQMLD